MFAFIGTTFLYTLLERNTEVGCFYKAVPKVRYTVAGNNPCLLFTNTMTVMNAYSLAAD